MDYLTFFSSALAEANSNPFKSVVYIQSATVADMCCGVGSVKRYEA